MQFTRYDRFKTVANTLLMSDQIEKQAVQELSRDTPAPLVIELFLTGLPNQGGTPTEHLVTYERFDEKEQIIYGHFQESEDILVLLLRQSGPATALIYEGSEGPSR